MGKILAKGLILVEIAALSSINSRTNLLEQVGMRVLQMAMDNTNAQAGKLLQTLEQTTKAMELSVHPHLGRNIDLRV